MAKARNKFWFFAVIVLALAALGVLFVSKAKAQPSSIFVEATASATTTRQYLSNGGTYTYQLDSNNTFNTSKPLNMYGVDSLAVNLQVEASSTATIYAVQEQVSNNGIDWYVVNTGTALAVATSTYTFTPQTVSTSSVALNLPYVPSIHTRLVFSASGAAGALYAEIILKKNPSTP